MRILPIIFFAVTFLFHSSVSAQGFVVDKNEKGSFAIVAREATTIYRRKNNIGETAMKFIKPLQTIFKNKND